MRTQSWVKVLAATLLPMSAWAVDGVLTKDTYITTANTAGNFGNLPSMNVGVGATSLVEFSLSSLPGSLRSEPRSARRLGVLRQQRQAEREHVGCLRDAGLG